MYWTKSPGTGGQVLSEDDFVVDEMPAKKFLAKYERKNGKVAAVGGPFFLYILKKRGTTTKDAVNFVCRKFGIQEAGFAGLKDKHAVTSQYITLRQRVDEFETDKISLKFVSPCKNMMQVGELEGNRFSITLHGCRKPENAKNVIKEMEKGMPNYFGPQRFSDNNADVGRMLLKRNYTAALDLINKNSNTPYTSIRNVGKKMLKFFIHAYQSFIFNSVLDNYITKNLTASFADTPVVGFDTKLKSDFFSRTIRELLAADGLAAKDFQIRDLQITCRGALRPAFIKVKRIGFEIKGEAKVAKQLRSALVLDFELPPGSYATVLIREITKTK